MQDTSPHYVSPQTVKSWLSDGAEIALIDVREMGQYGAGHPFFATPVPYSIFETRLPSLAPRRSVRLVLFDSGDGVAEHAARRAADLGYTSINVMQGGAPGWQKAGYTLFEGVNLPSKTFGELLEHARDTPRLTAQEVSALTQSGQEHVIVDGRPLSEYGKFNIPGGICCPNGELALRIGEIAPDPDTVVIVNCAGRTRSILGAQTLIDFGIANPVYALENGTQGWFLAGHKLENGASRSYPPPPSGQRREDLRARARALAKGIGIEFCTPAMAEAWLADQNRSTFLLDVRTQEEFDSGTLPRAHHAPGGQLVQATDQWVGVRGARIILIDDDTMRASLAAYWLHQLGHEVAVLEGGVESAQLMAPVPQSLQSVTDVPETDRPCDGAMIVDLRPSMAFRDGHIDGAHWAIRPRLGNLAIPEGQPVTLVAENASVASLAAKDLRERGVSECVWLHGGPQQWRAAGIAVAASPERPNDADCIDYVFFTHERHAGNADAARQYLAWETGLIDRLDAQERATFRIADI